MSNYKPTPMVSHRAGANDAAKVPSLENGKRTAYKQPVAQCVALNRGSSALAT